MRKSAKITGIALVSLLIFTLGIWQATLAADHRDRLTVSFLNVGQGEATLIEAPSGRSVLVDGGPDNSVLRALSAALPWWQRSIDVVVSTSPDKDDSVGLVDVLSRYSVGTIVRSSVSGTDAFSHALDSSIAAAHVRGASVVVAKRGEVIELGSGAYIEILAPDRNDAGIGASDGCVVTRVVYGATAFLLPCDASQGLQNYLTYLDGTKLHTDVLEIGQGGATKSLSPVFAGYVSPAYAVYSRGCDTPPAQEVADMLSKFGVEAHDTCKEGTVTFISDGASVRVE